jgi:(2Fe-2S) ferredoxin
MSQEGKILKAAVDKLGISQYRRHILLCAGPKCCKEDMGQGVWLYLKKRCDELGLAPGSVYRSRVACLRVCTHGPIAVVYPEGTWYRLVNKEACEEIIQSHLIGGVPVQKLAFAENPLEVGKP